MNKRIVLAAILLIGLAGCSTPRYSCPLEEGSPCRSMSAVWDSQTRPASASRRVDSGTAANSRADSKVSWNAEQLGFQGGQLNDPDGTPVYITGKPYMVWVPGSKDAEGRVQSGRYIYFATPSDWTMGSITDNRNGGDILGPKKPEGYSGATQLGTKSSLTPAAAQVNKLAADQQAQQKGSEVFPIVRAPDSKKN